MLRNFYLNFILKYPIALLLGLLLVLAGLGYEASKLEVDASSETLLLEDDPDLRYSRLVNERYYSPDFLVITYTPKEGRSLLDDATREHMDAIKADLEKIQRVNDVLTLWDVPLLESPPKPIKELLDDVPTLRTPWIDKELAKKELLNSPIYQEHLVNQAFTTSAILVNLKDDKTWRDLVKRRYELREKQRTEGLSGAEQAELDQLQVDFKTHRDEMRVKDHEFIQAMRALIARHNDQADLFLGGVTMIADDLVTFVKNDLRFFGTGVLVFLVATLWFIFRQARWILIPLLTCGTSVLATAGFLGIFGWEVTVISSNFISIQIIITMALTIHLIVKYRELVELMPEASQKELVAEASASMFKPCAFMALTTVAGFASLLLSGILPVINFGWMMSVGIFVTLFLVFLIFPAVLILLPKIEANKAFESHFVITKRFADLTEHRGKWVLGVSGVLLVLCVVGAARLRVENSFIDYFKESTEIYQGMKVIDQNLGGTTPLDVTLNFSKPQEEAAQPAVAASEDEFSDFDAFEAEFAETADEAQYWFTAAKMAEVEKVHDYLDQYKETGKVLSLGTMLKVGKTLNEGEPLDNFKLALVYNELPDRFKKIIMDPYVDVERDQVRFAIRVRDSEPDLRRDELLKQIRQGLQDDLGLEPDRFRLSGMLVMYNNMLQSLYDSQIKTLGAVLAVLMVMFLILFRSLKIALIAILPNVLSVGTVLGFMGWADIPLDMMTITIAAISVGIAVDDTIHYIHRFKIEFEKDHNYVATMHRCHESIGYAMYYTSVTIVIGFSILVISNFIPSIFFGLLTGMAMVVALVAALTLLPELIIFLKPFGKEKA
ncbi:MAG: MMPL family transporter [bacterium]|nr:MMPL family transporter [bacterium]